MAWVGLALDIVANLVSTVAGSILMFQQDFTSMTAYIFLILGAFAAFNVSLYESFLVGGLDSKVTD